MPQKVSSTNAPALSLSTRGKATSSDLVLPSLSLSTSKVPCEYLSLAFLNLPSPFALPS